MTRIPHSLCRRCKREHVRASNCRWLFDFSVQCCLSNAIFCSGAHHLVSLDISHNPLHQVRAFSSSSPCSLQSALHLMYVISISCRRTCIDCACCSSFWPMNAGSSPFICTNSISLYLQQLICFQAQVPPEKSLAATAPAGHACLLCDF